MNGNPTGRWVSVAAAILLFAIPGAVADERWLLRGLLDAEVWNTDPSSALLSRDGGRTAPGGDLQLWFAADLHPRLQTVVVGRIQGGSAHRPNGVTSTVQQAYVRTTLGSARRVFLDLGQLQTELGNYSSRYLSSVNPLIGGPFAYSVSHPAGLRLAGAVGRYDFRVSIIDQPLINDHFLPRAGSTLRPSLSAGVTPIRGLRFGAYATRGAYLNRQLQPFIDSGRSWRDYEQRVLGLDVHFSRRYLELNADYNRKRYEVPSFDAPFRGSAGFVEIKYVIRPRWFVALRGSRNDCVEVRSPGPSGSSWRAFPSRFDDVEIGAGFRATHGVLVKAAYRETFWESTFYPEGRALSVQLSYGFDVRDALDRLR